MAQAVQIDASSTASGSVDITKSNLIGAEFPASKTGTVFAVHVSRDNSTFLPLYDWTSTAVSITAVASTATAHALDPTYTAGWGYAKFVASSSQSSAITIQALTKRL